MPWVSADECLRVPDVPTTRTCGCYEREEDDDRYFSDSRLHTTQEVYLDPEILFELYVLREWSLDKIARNSSRIFQLDRNVAHTTIKNHLLRNNIPIRKLYAKKGS